MRARNVKTSATSAKRRVTASSRRGQPTRHRRREVPPRLIPVLPSPDKPLHYLFDGFPYLWRMDDGRLVKVFVAYRLNDPRVDECGGGDGPFIDEIRWCGPEAERLEQYVASGQKRLPPRPREHVIGVRLIERCGPVWRVITIPFAGVRWFRAGRLLGVAVNAEEQFRVWLERVEEDLNWKARR